MNKIILQVAVVSPDTFLHEDDRDIPGQYVVTLADGVGPESAADAALDHFHNNIPVRCLDDFEFKVITEAGLELQPNPDHESYSSVGLACSVDKL